jgi:hypothetical protein
VFDEMLKCLQPGMNAASTWSVGQVQEGSEQEAVDKVCRDDWSYTQHI